MKPDADRLLNEASAGRSPRTASRWVCTPSWTQVLRKELAPAPDGPLAGSVARTVVRRRVSRNREAAAQ